MALLVPLLLAWTFSACRQDEPGESRIDLAGASAAELEFWSARFRSESLARERLARDQALRRMARTFGLSASPVSFEALQAAWREENRRRAEVLAAGGLLYGPESLDLAAFLDGHSHRLARALRDVLRRQGSLECGNDALEARYRDSLAAGRIVPDSDTVIVEIRPIPRKASASRSAPAETLSLHRGNLRQACELLGENCTAIAVLAPGDSLAWESGAGRSMVASGLSRVQGSIPPFERILPMLRGRCEDAAFEALVAGELARAARASRATQSPTPTPEE